MVHFDKATVKYIQRLNFQSKAVIFVLGFNPSFYFKNAHIKIRINFHQYQRGFFNICLIENIHN